MLAGSAHAAGFRSDWGRQIERVWVGPEYWSNPLQDWRIAGGRLVCINPAENRNVHLLTHHLGSGTGEFEMTVRLGAKGIAPDARIGFSVGIRGPLDDYRSALIRGRGLNLGVTGSGELFIGERTESRRTGIPLENLKLTLTAQSADAQYRLSLTAADPETGRRIAQLSHNVPAGRLIGNLALLCHAESERSGASVWYSDWVVSGPKIDAREDQVFGPILFSQYTLSRGVMKLTAQMAPTGVKNNRSVFLEIQKEGAGAWQRIAEALIDRLSRTATFRIAHWDSARDVSYRIVYPMKFSDDSVRDYFWTGTVRRDPVEKAEIVVAGFTGNTDAGFPNNEVARGVAYHDPDLLVFTGDQLYENVGGYGVRRTHDIELATLDYLRKWYLFGWAFKDLMRDRPTICMPDDHDVYQGNIWGAGGRSVPTMQAHNRGGYFMPAAWVNMVQRTQTSHLPDPYDPTPVEQGITVYYTRMNYGRLSIAIIEDRKFKSGPDGLIAETGTGRPDHVADPNFDPTTIDLPEARLLGDRQMSFLKDWVKDWRGADMKMVVSQTIFAQVPNIHGQEKARLVADLDANGWPQSGRNRALDVMRRAFAFHLSGDQHLPMIVQYGINEWGDASYAFCVPSIAAGYPRAFLPDQPGKNRLPGMPEHTGEFRDGFGNKFTAWAIGNPQEPLREPTLEQLHDKASGYGIVRFNKDSREITIECWPLLSDPSDPRQQFEGWPKTIRVEENYARPARGHLPAIEISGMEDPVIEVISEWDNDFVYALRIKGTTFRPKVFKNDYPYTIKVGEPGTSKMRTLTGIMPTEDASETIEVDF